jgi:NAD(P)-dependent dehydrogenase (short-subunit alcohol dehydrogenase family)
MDLELRGKSVLVTGASKGTGLECAEAGAAEGANVHLASRNAEELKKNAADSTAKHNVGATCHPLDLGISKNVMALAQTCGDVDILVNNAGPNPGRVETERQQKHMMEDTGKKFGDPARWKEIQAEVFKALPFKRSAYPAEVADLATILAFARAAYISATVVTIDAGQSLRQRTY